MADKSSVWQQLTKLALDKKPGDVAAAQRWAQAKFHSFYGDFSRKRVDSTEPALPCAELISRIKADNIRYAARKQKSERWSADAKIARDMRNAGVLS